MLEQERIDELSEELKLEHTQAALPLTTEAVGFIWWALQNHKTNQKNEMKTTRRVKQALRKKAFEKIVMPNGEEGERYRECVIAIGKKDIKRLNTLSDKLASEDKGLAGMLHEGFLDMSDAIDEVLDMLDAEKRAKDETQNEA